MNVSITSEYRIRFLREEEDVSVIAEVCQREDWSYSIHDFICAQTYDSTAFMLGELKGQIISTIMGLKWDPTYAFLTAYTVHPEHRKQGYGLKLFQGMMHNLADRNIALLAVAGKEGMYLKSGFVCGYDVSFCIGVAKHLDHPWHSHILNALTVPLADLLAYDRLHFPVPRGKFVELFIREPGTLARVYVEDGKIRGFGMIRQGHPWAHIGPLFAATTSIASALWSSLVNTLAVGDKYCIFLPMPMRHPHSCTLMAQQNKHLNPS